VKVACAHGSSWPSVAIDTVMSMVEWPAQVIYLQVVEVG
jgi:hypothetical protein